MNQPINERLASIIGWKFCDKYGLWEDPSGVYKPDNKVFFKLPNIAESFLIWESFVAPLISACEKAAKTRMDSDLIYLIQKNNASKYKRHVSAACMSLSELHDLGFIEKGGQSMTPITITFTPPTGTHCEQTPPPGTRQSCKMLVTANDNLYECLAFNATLECDFSRWHGLPMTWALKCPQCIKEGGVE